MSAATEALKAAADQVVVVVTNLKAEVATLTEQVTNLTAQVAAIQANQEDTAAINAVTTELTDAAK